MSPWAILSLLAVLGVLGGLNLWLRRAAGGRLAGPGLRVVAARRLGSGHGVWILEVDERRLLLGSGRDGLRVLSELRAPDPPKGG